MFFRPSATYSVVPPKIATVSAYGSPTPSARIRAGKKFGLHDGVDRGVSRHDRQAEHHQTECGHARIPDVRHRRQQRDGEQRRTDAERDQQRPAADPVRQRTEHRLQADEDHQRDEVDPRHLLLGQARGVDHELLHVCGEGVERDRPAERQPDHRQTLPRIRRAGPQTSALAALFDRELEILRLVHRAAQPHHRQRGRRADDERDAPAPACICAGVSTAEGRSARRAPQLSAGQRDVLERRVEPRRCGVATSLK